MHIWEFLCSLNGKDFVHQDLEWKTQEMGGFAHMCGGSRLWTELVDMAFSSRTAFSDAGHSADSPEEARLSVNLPRKALQWGACLGRHEVEKLGWQHPINEKNLRDTVNQFLKQKWQGAMNTRDGDVTSVFATGVEMMHNGLIQRTITGQGTWTQIKKSRKKIWRRNSWTQREKDMTENFAFVIRNYSLQVGREGGVFSNSCQNLATNTDTSYLTVLPGACAGPLPICSQLPLHFVISSNIHRWKFSTTWNL